MAPFIDLGWELPRSDEQGVDHLAADAGLLVAAGYVVEDHVGRRARAYVRLPDGTIVQHDPPGFDDVVDIAILEDVIGVQIRDSRPAASAGRKPVPSPPAPLPEGEGSRAGTCLTPPLPLAGEGVGG